MINQSIWYCFHCADAQGTNTNQSKQIWQWMKEAKEKSSFTSLERLFITKIIKVLIKMRVRDLIAEVIDQIHYECEKTYSIV